MRESRLKTTQNCNRDSCFDLVGSRQHSVASYELIGWLTDHLHMSVFLLTMKISQ